MRAHHLLGLLLLTPILSAQQPPARPVITLDTAASTDQLLTWLHSDDPRLIAWSVTLAARSNETAVLTAAAQLVEPAHTPAVLQPTRTNAAVAAILDAIIQRNITLSAEALRYLREGFAPQALILASRLPSSESQPYFFEWYRYGDRGTEAQREAVRISAMLLAKNPPPDFVASILHDAAQTLHIAVYSTPNHGFSSNGEGGACGDGGGTAPPAGWPPVSSYFLEENSPNSTQILVQLGTDRVGWSRETFYGGIGSCSYVKPLNDTTRHRLLAYWLNLDPRDMPWQPNEPIAVVFVSQAAYEVDLGHIIEQHRRLLLRTAQEVYAHAHGGDTPPDSSTYTPQLHVLIHCAEKPCHIDGQ